MGLLGRCLEVASDEGHEDHTACLSCPPLHGPKQQAELLRTDAHALRLLAESPSFYRLWRECIKQPLSARFASNRMAAWSSAVPEDMKFANPAPAKLAHKDPQGPRLSLSEASARPSSESQSGIQSSFPQVCLRCVNENRTLWQVLQQSVELTHAEFIHGALPGDEWQATTLSCAERW